LSKRVLVIFGNIEWGRNQAFFVGSLVRIEDIHSPCVVNSVGGGIDGFVLWDEITRGMAPCGVDSVRTRPETITTPHRRIEIIKSRSDDAV
jgi:hypothetical protein